VTESARLADYDDIPRLVEIAIEHSKHIVDQRGGELMLKEDGPAGPDEYADELTQAIASPTSIVVAGSFGGVVFGFGRMEFVDLNGNSLLARIHELIVAEPAREVGIGEAMMNLLLQQAEGRGCFGVDAVALPGDRETKNFFESFGLKARKLVVHRSLTTDE
jgi:ribosomal protein S18 acetylase RimI-like enzyme